jgi:hypothetical protein
MKVDEFYDMLPREFWNKLEGFHELENLRQRNDWERTRWSTCLLLNIQLPKGKSLKPTDLVQFEWDQKKGKIDFKELKERAEHFKKLDEFNKNKKLENGE